MGESSLLVFHLIVGMNEVRQVDFPNLLLLFRKDALKATIDLDNYDNENILGFH